MVILAGMDVLPQRLANTFTQPLPLPSLCPLRQLFTPHHKQTLTTPTRPNDLCMTRRTIARMALFRTRMPTRPGSRAGGGARGNGIGTFRSDPNGRWEGGEGGLGACAVRDECWGGGAGEGREGMGVAFLCLSVLIARQYGGNENPGYSVSFETERHNHRDTARSKCPSARFRRSSLRGARPEAPLNP